MLKGCERPEDLLGEANLMLDLKLALMQRMLRAKLTEHLGCEHGETPAGGQANCRNGSGRKTVKCKDNTLEIAVKARWRTHSNLFVRTTRNGCQTIESRPASARCRVLSCERETK